MELYKEVAVANIGLLKKAKIRLGGLTFIYGPNGAGKSTLLRSIESFSNIRSLAISGCPIRKTAEKLLQKYQSGIDGQFIALNYGNELERCSEIKNYYACGKDSEDFPVYLNNSDFDSKEDYDQQISDIEVCMADMRSEAWEKESHKIKTGLKVLAGPVFTISKNKQPKYLINIDRSILITLDDINLTRMQPKVCIPCKSYFRISGRMSEQSTNWLDAVSCEWLGTSATPTKKKAAETFIAKQLYHLTHQREIKRIEPLRTIIKESDITGGGKSFMGLNMEKEALLKTNEWFMSEDKFNLGMRIEDITFQSHSTSLLNENQNHNTLRKIALKDMKTGRYYSFENVGTGISQLAPILSWIFSSAKKLILIEQPEIHLHPAMQATLMDAIIESVQKGHQIIIETHSETFLLRAMRRLRENLLNKYVDKKRNNLKSLSFNNQKESQANIDNVQVYFFEKKEGSTTVKNLRLDHEGKLIDDWPGGFFEEGIREVLV